MFEQAGFTQGEKDGYADAIAGKRHRPRPSLARSVLSSGFQQGYMAGYDQSYFNTKQAIAREKVRNEKTHGPQQIGWEDGYHDKASRSDRLKDEAERLAYRRGYKRGYQHRNDERAKALRDNRTRIHKVPTSQDQIDREF